MTDLPHPILGAKSRENEKELGGGSLFAVFSIVFRLDFENEIGYTIRYERKTPFWAIEYSLNSHKPLDFEKRNFLWFKL